MSSSTIGRIQIALGALGARGIQLGLRVFGRSIAKSDAPWLDGPVGRAGPIGENFYSDLADASGLHVHRNRDEAGLVPQMGILASPAFDVAMLDPAVRHFYEHTSAYRLDVWSETRFPARLMLWLLVTTVSRYMNQLNFPIHGLEMSRGMTSDIVELVDDTGRATLTGWFRKVLSTGRVIYTGFYMTQRPPGHDGACIKVVFPLPRGNASVLLRPGFDNGRFTLESAGRTFGDPGFYRLLDVGNGRWRVFYLRTLKEYFEVYRDDEGVLRCDHRVMFWGMTMLRLHYRMTRIAVAPSVD